MLTSRYVTSQLHFAYLLTITVPLYTSDAEMTCLKLTELQSEYAEMTCLKLLTFETVFKFGLKYFLMNI